MDGVAPIRFQTSLFLKRKYAANAGINPQTIMTNASLSPFATGPLMLFITELEASLRMYHVSIEPPDAVAARIMTSMMLGTNRMKTNVRIEAELDFFINALNSVAIPVSEKMYNAQYPSEGKMLAVNPPVLIAMMIAATM